MLLEVKIPEVGESITEGILAEWSKADGDWVEAEEPLLVLETDKITMTVNAEVAGQLKILVPEGATVQVGQVVGTIDPDAEPRAVPVGEKPAAEDEKASAARTGAPHSPAAVALRGGPLEPARRDAPGRCQAGASQGALAGGAAHGLGAPPGSGGHRGHWQGRADHQGGRGAPHRRASAAERAIRWAGVGDSADRPGRSGPDRGSGRNPGSARRAGDRAPDPRTHDAPAPAGRRTAGGGAATLGHLDHLQRGRHERGDGPPSPLQGPVQGAPRHRSRLHVLLRQGLDRRARDGPPGEHLHRRRPGRHQPLLRHRDRGEHRPGTGGAGAARCGPAFHGRGRGPDRRLLAPRPGAQARAERAHRGGVHDLQRRRLRVHAVDPDPQSAGERDPRACTPSRSDPWWSTTRSRSGR